MKLRVIWRGQAVQLNKARVEQVIRKVVKEHGLAGKVEVSVSLVDDEEMAGLNQRYLGKKGTTDVLSFPLEKEKGPDGVIRLGDVVVSLDQAERQAKEKKADLVEEMEFLVRHGALHLLGVHHD